MAWDWQSRDKIDNAFRAVDITIEWLQRLVERLNGGLASAAMERLSPVLFPPTQLQAVVTEIKNNLPTGWALTPCNTGQKYVEILSRGHSKRRLD
jgi:hypothetical protein